MEGIMLPDIEIKWSKARKITMKTKYLTNRFRTYVSVNIVHCFTTKFLIFLENHPV